MEYSIIFCTDGNNTVKEEHITDLARARGRFHHWCEALINDKSFTTGMIKLMDENLDCVEGKMELIVHEVQETTLPEASE